MSNMKIARFIHISRSSFPIKFNLLSIFPSLRHAVEILFYLILSYLPERFATMQCCFDFEPNLFLPICFIHLFNGRPTKYRRTMKFEKQIS